MEIKHMITILWEYFYDMMITSSPHMFTITIYGIPRKSFA